MITITRKSKLLAAGVAAAAMLTPAAALAGTATVNWQVPMTHSKAYPTASGSAQYQSQPGQRELQIEVDHLRTLAGKYVVFYANGVKLGSAKVSSTGIGQIDRNTELGQSVPTIVHGSTVAAKTGTGTLIANGKF